MKGTHSGKVLVDAGVIRTAAQDVWTDGCSLDAEGYGMNAASVKCFNEGLRRRKDVVGVVLCALRSRKERNGTIYAL